jgi:hypothetical protein
MIRRQIEIDEESDRILTDLAADRQGDVNGALSELLHAHESIECFVEECEAAQREQLMGQRERAERGFREGRFTTWDQVKRNHNL